MLLPERGTVPVLFLLDTFSRHEVVQANTLGASEYIAYPCPNDTFIALLGKLVNQTDLQKLSLGGILHDIGKAMVPLEKAIEIMLEFTRPIGHLPG